LRETVKTTDSVRLKSWAQALSKEPSCRTEGTSRTYCLQNLSKNIKIESFKEIIGYLAIVLLDEGFWSFIKIHSFLILKIQKSAKTEVLKYMKQRCWL
jgi:hypothetical protein